MARIIYFSLIFTLNMVISSNGRAELVISGNTTQLTSFPCMVQIVNQNGDHICGGCLITDENVLTAAQCVAKYSPKGTKRSLRVRGGDVHITESDLPTWQIRDVRKFIVHPEYNEKTMENDIALLRLLEPFAQSVNINAVAMGFHEPKGFCYLPGWGGTQENSVFTNTLHHVLLTITSKDKCKPNVKNTICAIETYGKSGGCKGDIGGPLICNNRIHGIFIGPDSACDGKSGIFTEVGRFQDWLEKNIHMHKSTSRRRLSRSNTSNPGECNKLIVTLLVACFVYLKSIKVR